MLFDLDADGLVARDEVVTGLAEFVGASSSLL